MMRMPIHPAARVAAGLLAVCAAPALAQSTSHLPAASSPADGDLISISQGSGCPTAVAPCADKKLAFSQLRTWTGVAFQQLDADLSAIAALATTSTGRDLLTSANAAAIRSKAGVVIGTDVQAYDFDLAIYAGITPGATGQALLATATPAAARATLQVQTPYVSGNYYIPGGVILGTGSPAAAGSDSLRLLPGTIREPITATSLGLRVTTAAASGNCKMAVYAAAAGSLLPTGAPLASTVAQSTTAVGTKEDTTISVALAPGTYWWATLCDTSAATAVMVSVNTASFASAGLVGGSTLATIMGGTSAALTGYSKAQTYASGFPTLTGNATTDSLTAVSTSTVPVLAFKVQ